MKPDAFLVLGDTNSCLCAIAAKKRHIPIFHMEAGNRCFDQRAVSYTHLDVYKRQELYGTRCLMLYWRKEIKELILYMMRYWGMVLILF